jgi:hypothetical protein
MFFLPVMRFMASIGLADRLRPPTAPPLLGGFFRIKATELPQFGTLPIDACGELV